MSRGMRNFILGTDWWTDCDDAVAIRILCRAHRQKSIKLLGIGINACMNDSVASLEGFLNTENVFDIPIGIDKTATDYGGHPPYQKNLTKYCKKYHSNNDAEDAVRLYRRILAKSDEPVELIEIGYLQVLAGLMKSKADDISPLCGDELIKKNVSKIWIMAGKWDEELGKENNFARAALSASSGEYVCKNCPVPITFLGYEVGESVISGRDLNENDPLYRVLCDHNSKNGRSSWDPMLVTMAIIGDESKAGYDTVSGTASVSKATGENSFVKDEFGNHKYVVKKHDDEFYENQINRLIM